MPVLKTNVILVWAGTNASIPSGWQRETALDVKFLKGTADATNPNTTGGNATHSHNAEANHSHNLNDHTHTLTINAGSGGEGNSNGGGSAIINTHTHNAISSGGVASGGGLSAVGATYASTSNNPPYYEVIFIKPTSPTNFIPNGAIVFVDTSTIPTGFAFCNGAGGTPDLRNKYLRGAGAGGDSGGTGGSTTNTHDLTHTHTVASHTHNSATTGAGVGSAYSNDSSGSAHVLNSHTHNITPDAGSDAISATAPSLVTAETVEPAYTKLVPIKNTSGVGKKVFLGMIAMTLSNLDALPAGFILCDGQGGTVDMRGRHLKMANATNESGNTGGSNTHTHASQNHTHTSTGHVHTVPNATHADQTKNVDASPATVAIPSTIHTITCGSTSPTYVDGSTSADSANNEPEYRTVAFIKLRVMANPGAFIPMFVDNIK